MAKHSSENYKIKKYNLEQYIPQLVNSRDAKGNTPLYYACMNNNKELAKKLIENGADVNARNENGNTALHAAFKRNNEEVIALLLKNEANPRLPNDGSKTPLFFAYPNIAKKFGLYEIPIFC